MPKQIYFEDVQDGMELPILEKRPTTQQLVKYAGASGDYYQIHYDQDFARVNGLPSVILHGALKNAFLGQMVTDWMGEAGTVKKLVAKYKEIDISDTPMYGKGVVTNKYVEGGENLVECEIWLENDRGQRTTTGSAVVVLPSRPN